MARKALIIALFAVLTFFALPATANAATPVARAPLAETATLIHGAVVLDAGTPVPGEQKTDAATNNTDGPLGLIFTSSTAPMLLLWGIGGASILITSLVVVLTIARRERTSVRDLERDDLMPTEA